MRLSRLWATGLRSSPRASLRRTGDVGDIGRRVKACVQHREAAPRFQGGCTERVRGRRRWSTTYISRTEALAAILRGGYVCWVAPGKNTCELSPASISRGREQALQRQESKRRGGRAAPAEVPVPMYSASGVQDKTRSRPVAASVKTNVLTWMSAFTCYLLSRGATGCSIHWQRDPSLQSRPRIVNKCLAGNVTSTRVECTVHACDCPRDRSREVPMYLTGPYGEPRR